MRPPVADGGPSDFTVTAEPDVADTYAELLSRSGGGCWAQQAERLAGGPAAVWPRRSYSLPLVVFIAGTEGAGHNLYQELLTDGKCKKVLLLEVNFQNQRSIKLINRSIIKQ